MSIVDIVTRHQLNSATKSADNGSATEQETIKRFAVASGAANRYEQEQSSEDDD